MYPQRQRGAKGARGGVKGAVPKCNRCPLGAEGAPGGVAGAPRERSGGARGAPRERQRGAKGAPRGHRARHFQGFSYAIK